MSEPGAKMPGQWFASAPGSTIRSQSLHVSRSALSASKAMELAKMQHAATMLPSAASSSKLLSIRRGLVGRRERALLAELLRR